MYSAIGSSPPSDIALISFKDKLAVIVDVLLPTVAKGVVLRRPLTMALADRWDVDRRAIRRLQKLRDKYGSGPLMLRVIGRKHALLLDKGDLARVLEEEPRFFTPGSDEKTAALGHFEPHVSLISKGVDRRERRDFNDAVLESACPDHAFAERFVAVAGEEARALIASCGPTVTWDEFSPVWDRIVRRIVLGDGAQNDTRLTNQLKELRSAGNWSFARARNDELLRIFRSRLDWHIARAEEGSLAAALARTPKSPATAPTSQATHWIFAFDAGGIATFSAWALLATHDDLRRRALEDAADNATTGGRSGRMRLPFLRACLLEALRLWPTTMIVHRQSTEETNWPAGIIPAGTSILIFAPYFHRDDTQLPYAHRFAPAIWVDNPAKAQLPLIPFSAGPGICPGRHVALLTGSAMLATLLAEREVAIVGEHRLGPESELPETLNHFAIELDVGTPRQAALASVKKGRM